MIIVRSASAERTVTGMAEYIDKVAATTIPTPPKENRVYLTDNLDDVFDAGWHEAQRCISNLPAADVRERVPVENVMEYRPVKYDPDEFFNRKKTNADRIRAMSDEELAEYLSTMQAHAFYHGMYHGKMSDETEWLEWLRQEATE